MSRAWRMWGPLAWAAAVLGGARIPGLVSRLPVLGVLDGPLGVAVGALALVVAARGAWRESLGWPRVSSRWWALPVLFVVSAGLGSYYTSRLRVTGDEPHYLIMAQSLWREGDLDLEDNYRREDYLEYTPGPIRPHYGAPRADGRPFPAHSPGLPALLAPAYAAGGRAACVVVLAACLALMAGEVRRLAVRAGGAASAGLAWAVAAGPPALLYSFHIYTEVPSALALAAALRLLLDAPSAAGASLAGLLAACLPFLHLKMIPAAAALGVVALARLRGRALAAFLGVVTVVAGAFGWHYFRVFGQATPLAIYGGVPAQATLSAPLAALGGLLLDRSFGLLPHAPVFVLALAGLPVLLGRARRTWPHLLVGAAVVAPALGWRMWWGGQCPPARFLVPAVPILALAAAARADDTPRGLARWRWPLLAAGFALVAVQTWDPGRLYLVNRGSRPTRLWEGVSGSRDVQVYLPSLVDGSAAEVRVALVWIAGLAVLLALDVLARRWDSADRLFTGLGLPLVLVLAGGIAIDGWARLAPSRPTSQGGTERPLKQTPTSTSSVPAPPKQTPTGSVLAPSRPAPSRTPPSSTSASASRGAGAWCRTARPG